MLIKNPNQNLFSFLQTTKLSEKSIAKGKDYDCIGDFCKEHELIHESLAFPKVIKGEEEWNEEDDEAFDYDYYTEFETRENKEKNPINSYL